jgi:hypothetical protein
MVVVPQSFEREGALYQSRISQKNVNIGIGALLDGAEWLNPQVCCNQHFYSPAKSRQAGALQQRTRLAEAHAVLFYMEKTGMIDTIDRTDYRIRAEKQRGKVAGRVMPVATIDQETSS